MLLAGRVVTQRDALDALGMIWSKNANAWERGAAYASGPDGRGTRSDVLLSIITAPQAVGDAGYRRIVLV